MCLHSISNNIKRRFFYDSKQFAEYFKKISDLEEVKMKQRILNGVITSAAVLVILAALSEIPVMAESLFLKDGSIIDGSIVSDAADSVTLKLPDSKLKKVPRSDIMRILYTKLKMGKIFIQKRDGKGIVAYIVDEDQESYTFRKELYSPEEFSFKRSEILFMAEKNPSGLQVVGNVETHKVTLSWLPPYDEVKRYNLYIKQNEKDKYELAYSTKEKTATLSNLSGRTTYYLIVTSVDRDDYESSPSNELKITTVAMAEVLLKDGNAFKAFLVSEDRDGYTLRNDLKKPEEYVVKRADVQFITDRFPSGLSGKGGTESIELKWFKPFDQMREYNIYIKKKGEDYKLASTSSDNTSTVKELTSNTEYTVKVTGVKKDKTETTSSNELKITTGNIPPDEPEVVSNSRSKTGDRTVTWNESVDRDGKVVKYRVYGTKDANRAMIAELSKTEYLVKDPGSYDAVEIVSVDERGGESAGAGMRISDGNTVLEFNPGVIFPITKFGKMAGLGYGGMLDYTRRNVFFDGFELGAGAGFYYTPGKDRLEEDRPKYHRFLIAPFMLNAGYRFWFGENFSVMPFISLGGAYFNMTYMNYDSFTLGETEINKNFVDPMAMCSLAIEYSMTETLSLSLNGGYGMFIEKSGPMQFVTAGMGIKYRF